MRQTLNSIGAKTMAQSTTKTATTANQSKTSKRIVQVKAKRKNAKKIVEIVDFPVVQKATTSTSNTRKVKQNVKPTAAQVNAAFEVSQGIIRDTANHLDDLIHASGKAGLSYWNAQGKAAIEYRSNWETFTGRAYTNKGDKGVKRPQSFAEYRDSQADLYGSWSKVKWNEVISIAQHWNVVEQMDQTDNLEKLGFSSCIKAIKLHLKENDTPANKKIAEDKKAKSDTKRETAKAKADQDANDLEAYKAGTHPSQQGSINISDLIKDPAKFGSLIGTMINKAYDDAGKIACMDAQAKKVIIKS
jgi:hypothetical protein